MVEPFLCRVISGVFVQAALSVGVRADVEALAVGPAEAIREFADHASPATAERLARTVRACLDAALDAAIDAYWRGGPAVAPQ